MRELIRITKTAIAHGDKELWINLINCADAGKKMVELLEAAGYKPDNLGPQRKYTKE